MRVAKPLLSRRVGAARRMRVLAMLLLLVVCAGAATVLLVRRPALRHALRYSSPPAQLVLPVEGLRSTGLRSTWHAPRSGGRRHQGADLFAPRGTPVLSATRGMVWKVGTDRLGGRVVTVLGEGPAFYYYAHLDAWTEGLEVGDRVEPGAQLGTVGNTGNAARTPPHLHFGIYRISWRGVAAVDPIPLLRQRGVQLSTRSTPR
jgi:murein DD-endopeptidase MepM/ murein hydrolase activator NlpD